MGVWLRCLFESGEARWDGWTGWDGQREAHQMLMLVQSLAALVG